MYTVPTVVLFVCSSSQRINDEGRLSLRYGVMYIIVIWYASAKVYNTKFVVFDGVFVAKLS
jgi:hypothetical protein